MATTNGLIKAISISNQRGMPKTNVPQAELKMDFGIVGDAHAGHGPRQVSLLSLESINELRKKGLNVSPGNFAENITTEGLNMQKLKVGSRLIIAGQVEIEVTQLGKRCHRKCGIFDRLGDCIMPREGVFARVTKPGPIKVGDTIEVVDDKSSNTDSQ